MNTAAPRSWSGPLVQAEAPPSLQGWRVERLLGRGAHATVWMASRDADGQRAAIKVVRLGGDMRCGQAAMARELEVLATLSHPGIVRVLAAGTTDDGRPFCAMDLVTGPDLAAILRLGRLPERPAASIARGIAEALSAAHARGVTHGDLKPSNVALDEAGRPVLLDFGLAVLAAEERGGTWREAAMVGQSRGRGPARLRGTPAYVAPEQLDGAPPTPAMDVHALGAILYEMLVGQRAFDGDSTHQLLYRIAFQPASPPSRLAAGVSQSIDSLVLSCLSKHPAERPTAREVAAALEAMRGSG